MCIRDSSVAFYRYNEAGGIQINPLQDMLHIAFLSEDYETYKPPFYEHVQGYIAQNQ